MDELQAPKSWWVGDPRVEPFMGPIAGAILRHLPHDKAFTDIYNRAYEAVFAALNSKQEK